MREEYTTSEFLSLFCKVGQLFWILTCFFIYLNTCIINMVEFRRNATNKIILLCLRCGIFFLVFVWRHMQSVLSIVLWTVFVINPIIPYQLFSIFDSYECRQTHVVPVLISKMSDIYLRFDTVWYQNFLHFSYYRH